jgi:hypothetical protein
LYNLRFQEADRSCSNKERLPIDLRESPAGVPLPVAGISEIEPVGALPGRRFEVICRWFRHRLCRHHPLRCRHQMKSHRRKSYHLFRSSRRRYRGRDRSCCRVLSPGRSGRTGAWCWCDPGQCCCCPGRSGERRKTSHRRCARRRTQTEKQPRKDKVQMPLTNDSASLLHLWGTKIATGGGHGFTTFGAGRRRGDGPAICACGDLSFGAVVADMKGEVRELPAQHHQSRTEAGKATSGPQPILPLVWLSAVPARANTLVGEGYFASQERVFFVSFRACRWA